MGPASTDPGTLGRAGRTCLRNRAARHACDRRGGADLGNSRGLVPVTFPQSGGSGLPGKSSP